MSGSELLWFIIFYGCAAAIPGPGMLAIVSCATTAGIRPAVAMGIGIILGDIIYFSLALYSLTLLAKNLGEYFFWIKLIGALYLIYKGISIFLQKKSKLKIKSKNLTSKLIVDLITGLAITLGNPKAMAFYFAALPQILDLKNLDNFDKVQILLTLITVLSLIISFYIFMALKMQKIAKGMDSNTIFSKMAGIIMVIAGISIAYN